MVQTETPIPALNPTKTKWNSLCLAIDGMDAIEGATCETTDPLVWDSESLSWSQKSQKRLNFEEKDGFKKLQ